MECVIKSNIKKKIISEKEIFNTVSRTLKRFGETDAKLSVCLVGEQKMCSLNFHYRKIQKPTDVLAFSIRENIKFPQEDNELGEVFVCPAVVKKNATESEIDYKEEFNRVLIHGILHLLGFDHATKKQEKEMFDLQESILNDL